MRRYWKLSERLTVKQADLVICDSRNIEAYIRREYGAYRPRTAFIAYGAETGPSALDDRDPRFADWMRTHRLTPGGYYLAVGRYVPENNYETMIREMMRSPTNKDFVLITNAGGGQLKRLEKKLRFAQDGRIKFAGAVYDQELLRKIRENAYASLHGHEVGGTNPSLLEGMAATGLNLLLDVKFNREVGGNAALYWTKEEGSLASLIKKADGMTREKREEYAAAAQRRIRENYSWQSVAQAYRNVFKA